MKYTYSLMLMSLMLVGCGHGPFVKLPPPPEQSYWERTGFGADLYCAKDHTLAGSIIGGQAYARKPHNMLENFDNGQDAVAFVVRNTSCTVPTDIELLERQVKELQ